jgi:hypothetical protein
LITVGSAVPSGAVTDVKTARSYFESSSNAMKAFISNSSVLPAKILTSKLPEQSGFTLYVPETPAPHARPQTNYFPAVAVHTCAPIVKADESVRLTRLTSSPINVGLLIHRQV